MTATEKPDPIAAQAHIMRAYQLTDSIYQGLMGLKSHVLELHELGVNPADWAQLVMQQFDSGATGDVSRAGEGLAQLITRIVLAPEKMTTSQLYDALVASTAVPGNGAVHGEDEDEGAPFQDFPATMRMGGILYRLFEEAGPWPEGQTPAIEAIVWLRHVTQPIRGALSETTEGALRMLSPAGPRPEDGLLEQFFDLSDVVFIAKTRTVTASPIVGRS